MRAGFAIVLVLIALIGGRIIPAFTRNWLVQQGFEKSAPVMFNRFDRVAIAAAAIGLAAWTASPYSPVVGLLLLAAGLLHVLRLGRWSGLLTLSNPLLFILHIGYAWLPIGLCLLGVSILGSPVPSTTALHALAAGAMGTMTLAVMTRATLGHTGRPLIADRWTIAIYILVTIGAVLRVASPFLPLDYLLVLRLAGAAWGGAFLLFALAYGPKLFSPRVDGAP